MTSIAKTIGDSFGWIRHSNFHPFNRPNLDSEFERFSICANAVVDIVLYRKAADGTYERRRPENTLLYEIVRDNAETSYAACETNGAPLPEFIKREVEGYLGLRSLVPRFRCDAVYPLQSAAPRSIFVQGARLLPIVHRSPDGADRDESHRLRDC